MYGLASIFLIANLGFVGVIVVISTATQYLSSYRGWIPVQAPCDFSGFLFELNCAADVVSFPQREVFVWLHVLDSLGGEKTEATKLRENPGG